ncbi:hypothetical protein NA57DRAFT_71559 [Rhizodiscina lignyota]|uniref:Uncharacterized protein n=1 Tax=Rhizodiscina lignyota TaxID=1504668 RepID=A0A9P4INP2_9PEZI|nr:hypothetical protein NA57DRAFT_71559 [Rhizodiscina lignyota]
MSGNEGPRLDLRSVVTPEGCEIANSVRVEDQQILQKCPFRNGGNEKGARFAWNVVLLVPKEKLYEVFGDEVSEIRNLLDFACQQALDQPNDEGLRTTALKLLNRITTVSNHTSVTAVLVKGIEWSVALDSHETYQNALKASFRNGYCQPEVLDAVYGLIHQRYSTTPFAWDWAQWLGDIVSEMSEFSSNQLIDFHECRVILGSKLQTEDLKRSFEAWIDRIFDEWLEEVTCYDFWDIRTMVKLLNLRDHEWGPKKVFPSLVQHLQVDQLLDKVREFYFVQGEPSLEPFLTQSYRHILQNTETFSLKAEDFCRQHDAPAFDSITCIGTPDARLETFLHLVEAGISLNLYAEVNRLIEVTSQEFLSATFLVKRIGPHTTFISKLIMGLVCRTEGHTDDIAMNHVRAIYIQLLKAVVEAFAKSKRAQPKAPTGWERKTIKGDGCSDCQMLNKFLRDPDRPIFRHPLTEDRQKHLLSQLNLRSFLIDVERRGRSHTLIITKTAQEFRDDLREWKSSCEPFKTWFHSLQSPHMKDVLGDDYKRWILLKDIGSVKSRRERIDESAHPPLSTVSSNHANVHQPPQVAGVKRKLEIIDLCGDMSDSD